VALSVEVAQNQCDFASEARRMIGISKSDPASEGAIPTRLVLLLGRAYYFILALIIAAAVVLGFRGRLDQNLLHPARPLPLILYVHAAVFTSWVILFMLQTALIGMGRAKLHRKVGVFGFVLGVTVTITGVATAIIMARFRARPGHADGAPFLILTLNDIVEYSIFFGLAIYWRKKPEFHRRLMFIATCTLMSAAVRRLLPSSAPDQWVYVGVDGLILLGLGGDWIVDKRFHPAYLFGLPAALLGQSIALYLCLSRSPAWIAIAHRLIGSQPSS
jgi:hypothetical protein